MRLSDFLQGPASRHVQYYPDLVGVLGSVTATILFGQLLYWRGKEKDPDGWLYKTQSQISEETALTREEQESARKKLREAGVLKEQKRGIPCRLWFWLDLDRVNDLWEKNQQNPQYEGKPQTRMRESRKQDCGKAASKDEGKPQATTLYYATDHNSSSKDKSDIPAASSPLAPQPLPPEVETAILELPQHLHRDARLIVQQEARPAEITASNIRLVGQKKDPTGALLRSAIRDDYAAAERQREAAEAERLEESRQRREREAEESARRLRTENEAYQRRRAAALAAIQEMSEDVRLMLQAEARRSAHGIAPMVEPALVDAVERHLTAKLAA